MSTCESCKSENIEFRFYTDGHHYKGPAKLPGSINQCLDCGLYYKKHDINTDELYDEAYVKISVDQVIPDSDYVLAFIPPTVKSILEIGVGDGQFLQLCKKNNFIAEGIELNKTLFEKARSKGLTVYNSKIENFEPVCKYDLIIMNNVIEHLESPGLAVKKIYNLLNDSGEVLILTPNHRSILVLFGLFLRSIGAPYLTDIIFSCSHTFFLNKSNLTMLLNNNNFSIRSVKTEPYSAHNSYTRMNKVLLFLIHYIDWIGKYTSLGAFRIICIGRKQ